MGSIEVILIWFCISIVTYVYVIYPIIIWLASVARRMRSRDFSEAVTQLPTVSLLLAAFNEEEVIAATIREALAIDYPPSKFEIVVATDGCTDATAEIIRSFDPQGVRLLEYHERRGKAAVLNESFPKLLGEIVILLDANTRASAGVAKALTRWFARPEVGVVCGRLVLVDRASGRNVDGLYWRYETFLKRCEARLGALLGANGAIYAIRRELFPTIPPGTIVDDFVIPLLAKQGTGCEIIYEPEAVASEETAPDVRSEFRRRARIGAGGFQSIGMLWRLLHPRHGWTAFAFLSHKILRWLCPFFLIGSLAANLMLLDRPAYRAALAAQLAFYATAGLMALAPAVAGPLRPLRLTTMFVGMNAALLVGFFRWALGRQGGAWRRTARGVEVARAAR